jgi:adenylate cyclase
MLNIYFTAMTDVIFARNGTIDKFIGDAIMAFWGAPIRDERHAMHSVRAALDMARALPDVNTELRAHGIPDLHIGIGIHTGEAVLGNIGSEKKLAYTAIGDNVNLASRLEGLTKQYGCAILISETTREQVRDAVPCRVVDAVRVKGKTLPIRIYTPVAAETSTELAAARELCERTAVAFELYQQRRFDAALAAYRALPEDELQAIFVARCEACLAKPPGADWDGIYTLTHK